MSNTKVKVKFVGIDTWNRPIFTDGNKNYFGSVDCLYQWNADENEVLNGSGGKKITEADLLYFGRSFDCEPWGSPCNVEIIRSNQ
jgi:hypothetical protein